jgi:hypothetical protein
VLKEKAKGEVKDARFYMLFKLLTNQSLEGGVNGARVVADR